LTSAGKCADQKKGRQMKKSHIKTSEWLKTAGLMLARRG